MEVQREQSFVVLPLLQEVIFLSSMALNLICFEKSKLFFTFQLFTWNHLYIFLFNLLVTFFPLFYAQGAQCLLIEGDTSIVRELKSLRLDLSISLLHCRANYITHPIASFYVSKFRLIVTQNLRLNVFRGDFASYLLFCSGWVYNLPWVMQVYQSPSVLCSHCLDSNVAFLYVVLDLVRIVHRRGKSPV